MKIILAMVTSLDGKSTKDNLPPSEWTSKEDRAHLHKLIVSQKLIVMGRKTYDASKSIIKVNPKKLWVVVTKNPQKYHNDLVPGQLEFSDESPAKLVQGLTDLGYKQSLKANAFKQMLLLGGADLNSSFFKAKLVDELWLTLEPRIFGKGNGLIAESNKDIKLKLKKVEKLNKQGTLLLKYQVK